MTRDGAVAIGQTIYRTVHGTKRQAQRALADFIAEISKPGYVTPSKATVREYFEDWLKDVEKDRRNSTYRQYESLVRRHIVPVIGHLRLSEVTPAAINEVFRLAQERGLQKSSLALLRQPLSITLRRAVKWGMIAVNPTTMVDHPGREDETELRILQPAQAAKLLDHIEGTWLHLPVVLALAAGLRRSEVLGLTWQRVDLDRASLTVSAQYNVRTGGLVPLKTRSSRRTVRLPQIATHALREQWVRQAERRLLCGKAYDQRGFVVAWDNGSPIPPDTLTKAFHNRSRDLGLEIRYHDLRHAHCSYLLAAGVPVKAVSGRVGHSSAKMTLDIYQHLLDDADQIAADAFDRAFGGTDKLAEM